MSTLRLYMKSGNIITVENVEKWMVETADNNGITYLKIEKAKRSGKARGLLMTTLDLSQIEAIEEV